MKRIYISEAFGLYKVSADGWQTTGASLDSALRKAYAKAVGSGLSAAGVLDLKHPDYDDLSVADVLEVLMGGGQQGGQIHEGIVSG